MGSARRAVRTSLKPDTETEQNDAHLGPVAHPPHVAFRVILTALRLPGPGGEDALLPRVGAPHGPVTDPFATLDGALEDSTIRQYGEGQRSGDTDK